MSARWDSLEVKAVCSIHEIVENVSGSVSLFCGVLGGGGLYCGYARIFLLTFQQVSKLCLNLVRFTLFRVHVSFESKPETKGRYFEIAPVHKTGSQHVLSECSRYQSGRTSCSSLRSLMYACRKWRKDHSRYNPLHILEKFRIFPVTRVEIWWEELTYPLELALDAGFFSVVTLLSWRVHVILRAERDGHLLFPWCIAIQGITSSRFNGLLIHPFL